MTRFEFASTVMRIYEAAGGAPVTITARFSDTNDADIQSAATLGIVNGTGNGSFFTARSAHAGAGCDHARQSLCPVP